VRGNRRSFATHPRRDAPDASRSRPAPVRTNGGTSIQPVVADSGESPTPRLDRLPRGSPSPMGSSAPFNRPAGGAPTHTPDRSRTEPKRTFRSTARPKAHPLPVRSAALRREEGGSTGRQVVTKDARPPFRPFIVRAYSHGRRPAPDDWRPLREAIARGLHGATPAILAFAKLPWMHRSPTKGTEVLGNPTLTRTSLTLKELDYARNKKVKYPRKYL